MSGVLADVLDTLREHWDEVWELLDDPARATLTELVNGPHEDPERAARSIVRLVRRHVPAGHPVRAALDLSVSRYSDGSAPDAEASSHRLRIALTGLTGVAALLAGRHVLQARRAQADDARPDDTPATAGPPAEVATPPADADDWLLAAPSVTAADYRSGGHDPGSPDLIRLTDRDGTVRLPSFQFTDASGRPHPLVVTINRLLDAADDPWGVADWWLGANAWLDAVPARLLGTPAERSLLPAARAEIAEW
ncbi:DUF3168 domain-containing protein [Kitasatospora sp. NPDC047058]|uniref:DUF3168 domain-containing protein n=1 Tax=Kitasatospora sp. NPDC047058 TaxID=3155620 RepID=UPI003404033F